MALLRDDQVILVFRAYNVLSMRRRQANGNIKAIVAERTDTLTRIS